MALPSIICPLGLKLVQPLHSGENHTLISKEYRDFNIASLKRLISHILSIRATTFLNPIKKNIRYFMFSTLFMFVSIVACQAQGSIGWAEQQIRNEYSKNPNASISVDYVNGDKNIIVVDQNATAAFNINSESQIRNYSLFQFRNQDILNDPIETFNAKYELISKDKSWKTKLRGPKINVDIGYSAKV